MAAINNDWLDALKGEFSKPYYRELFKKVNEEYSRYFRRQMTFSMHFI